MSEHRCPGCGQLMPLVRLLPPLDDHPRLGAFYCKPCQYADTIPVLPETEAPSLAPA